MTEYTKGYAPIFCYEELEKRILFSGDIVPAVESAADEAQAVVAEVPPAETTVASEAAAEPVAAQTADDPKWELVLVTDDVTDYDQLISGLEGEKGNRIFEVVVLQSDKNGIDQVSHILAQHENLAAVHFITHGTDGQIDLGETRLDINSLERHAGQIAGWGQALTENGDILLYGCNTGSQAGQSFLNRLADLTGADIAASDDTTGHEDLGGDWVLESRTGKVETQGAMSMDIKADWRSTLDISSGLVAHYMHEYMQILHNPFLCSSEHIIVSSEV